MIHRPAPPQGPFDLAVIGGGINGAGIARDAVLRGLSVCLFERGDIGGGTSSATSKMVHGGIRYLEQLHLPLVFEALRERAVLLRIAPHLVRPCPFVIPIQSGSARGEGWIRAGLFLYDLLALGRRLGRARILRPEEAIELAPGLSPEGLRAGGLYYDGVMDDARLCLANALDAREIGGGRFVLRTRAQVIGRRASSPIELTVRDLTGGEEYSVLAHRVARVVGPWTDSPEGAVPEGRRPLLLPSKGAHLLLPPRSQLLGAAAPAGAAADGHGLLLNHSRDDRVFFVVPWMGLTLVGTTETPFAGDPGSVRVEAADVEYLLGEFLRVFPGVRLRPRDLLGAFAGVRPLARGAGLFRDPHRASRVHRIVDDGRGTLTVVGGKYTTYRAVAREVVGRLRPGTQCDTGRRPLPGGERGPWEAYSRGDGRGPIDLLGADLSRALFGRYGCRLGEVLEAAREDRSLLEPLGPGVLRVEARYAVEREEVLYPEDFLRRRTLLRFSPGNGRESYDIVEAEIRRALGPHAPKDLEAAREAYFEEIAREDGLRELVGTYR